MTTDDAALKALAAGEGLARAIQSTARPGSGMREATMAMERVRTLAQGIGPDLAPLIADPLVTDVLINSGAVWIDRGGGLERVDTAIAGEEGTRRLAIHMAAACGKRLDDSSPIVDGTLPGGVRLHAVLPHPSASGTLVSLRTSRARALSITDMEESGSIAALMAAVLRRLVERRANVLVSGATGCGKTTLLSALLGLVPAHERIVCIEEIPELRPDHPHIVCLAERRANIQGAGAIPLSELVRAAMRMRPDRLILGECRGVEVRDVLLALNTGHDGGWATLHANGADDVPARLMALGALAGMSDTAIAAQAVAAIDAVVHMRRGPVGADGVNRRRWVAQVAVLEREGGELRSVLALTVDEDGAARTHAGWDRLCVVTGPIDCDAFVPDRGE